MEPADLKARGLPPHRLETLADGIFAIAMTLLVLELRIPETLSPNGLAGQLTGLLPRFASFFISFIVLGVYWFGHHQTYHFVVRVNRTLVWLNILFFMGVALVPFAASLLGAHPLDPVALSVYGVILAVLAGVGYAVWWYITGDRGLVDQKLDADLVRKVRMWIAFGPLVSVVAIVMAFVNPTVTLGIYLVLPVLFILFNPVNSYFERLRQGKG